MPLPTRDTAKSIAISMVVQPSMGPNFPSTATIKTRLSAPLVV